MTRLWIVRHGNTFAPGTPARRIGLRTDLPLVASGRAQARALAAHFDALGVRFDHVAAGPLRRTREMAALIAPGAPILSRGWLAEIDHGPDENGEEEAVRARIGAEALAAWDRAGEAPPDWIADAEARRAGWRAALAPGHGTWLMVTSNGAARFVLDATPALAAAAAALPSRALATGAWGEIVCDPSPRLVAWNHRP
ncbi:histidine phosphatase family protein [Sphingomonas morindae]|uniref:Histidine phosphatase family protein n=1 Tax=Sphingomonas morindae TaxID=1541170 RepID=A0ABY4X640_9SPHN|nr:phosphoglycerate mutase family protein [Sphingomonas morindae]USI72373.1 histidine phosphatase family protein [Sphingomonas morindae]